MTIDKNTLNFSPVDKEFYDNIYQSPNGNVSSFNSDAAFDKLNLHAWRIINNMTSDIMIIGKAFTEESIFSEFEEEKIKFAICATIDYWDQYDFIGNERKEKISTSDNQGSFDMDIQNIDPDKTWLYLPRIALDYLIAAGVFERLENVDYLPAFDIDSYVKFSQLLDEVVILTANLPGMPQLENPSVKDALEYLHRLIQEGFEGVANTYLVPTVDAHESYEGVVELPDGTTKPQNTINKENATLLNLVRDAISALQSAAAFDTLPFYGELIQTISLEKVWKQIFISPDKLEDGNYHKDTYMQFHLIADIGDGNGEQDYRSFEDLEAAGGTYENIIDMYFETISEILEWRMTVSAFGSGKTDLPVQFRALATKPDSTTEELIMDVNSGKKGDITFNYISAEPQDHNKYPIGTKIRWYVQVDPTFGGTFTFDITGFKVLESVAKTNISFLNVYDCNDNLVTSKDVVSKEAIYACRDEANQRMDNIETSIGDLENEDISLLDKINALNETSTLLSTNGGSGSRNYTLSEPYTNFNKIVVVAGLNSSVNEKRSTMYLNITEISSSKYYQIDSGGWCQFEFPNTTTLHQKLEDSLWISGVYGIERNVQATIKWLKTKLNVNKREIKLVYKLWLKHKNIEKIKKEIKYG